MAEFQINKGIGKSVEFKGLKSQYLFILVGGLLAIFILFVVIYMVGLPQWLCIAIAVVSATLLVWQTFSLNAKYGEHGMMKLQAKGYHPRYIISRRKIPNLMTTRR